DRVGAGYTLVARSGTLTQATSATFAVTPAVATAVRFVQQPAGGVAGAGIGTVTVQIIDGVGHPFTNSSARVTLTLANDPGGATLGGTTTVTAVNGVATFTDL